MQDRPFDDWELSNSNSQLRKDGVQGGRIKGRQFRASFDDWTLANSNVAPRGRGSTGFDDN